MAFIWIYKKIFADKLLQKTNPTGKDGAKPMPPLIPYGFIQTAKELTGPRAPWFMLENSRWSPGSIYRYHVTLYGRNLPPLVAIGDVEVAHAVLKDSKSYKPKFLYSMMDRMGGPNILTSEGHRWQHARKGVAPAFASKHITRMNDVINNQINTWIIETLMPKYVETGEPFDVAHEFLRQVLKGISLAGFNYSMSDEEANMFITETNIALIEIMAQAVNPVRKALRHFIPAARRLVEADKRLHKIAQNVLDHYRSTVHSQDETIISMIVNNDSYSSDKERLADIRLFFFAGYDTTAYTLCWTLLELAKNPSEQMKLRNALRGVQISERRNVPELRCVIKEGMRLYPVAVAGGRRALANDFTTDKYFLPKGTIVTISNIAIHRNAKYFDDPDEFRPSRWKDPSKEASMAFMPFALGRRNCVGQSLANAELYTILATLISGFEFTVFDEGEKDYFVTLKPVGAKLIAKNI